MNKSELAWRSLWGLALWMLPPVLILAGCTQNRSTSQENKIRLPKVVLNNGMDAFEQWIEIRPLFDKDESPALIIHCKGPYGVVGDWETHTVCWAGISEVEVGYEVVKIQTHYHYAYESGPMTTQNGYWPVDVSGDGLEDILVLGWSFGERGQGVKNNKGEWEYRRFPYNRPTKIRLIRRKAIKGCPSVVESDKTIPWTKIVEEPDRYGRLLRKALKHCKSPIWRDRLNEALKQLQKQARSKNGRAKKTLEQGRFGNPQI